jgi:pyruvate formate lyase activating enzyme
MIAGLQSCSFIDFPGRLAAVLFTQGCNLRCRYCHNPQLCAPAGEEMLFIEDVSKFLRRRSGRLTGVVISGGEPSIHGQLRHLIDLVHSLGFGVKLDTNGMLPERVRDLVLVAHVDYVAVDVKVAPGTSSKWLCGADTQAESALKTVRYLVENGIQCEARTTLINSIHNTAELDSLVRALYAAGVRAWRLQPVRASRVLDQSLHWAPPDAEVILHAIATASSFGIEATCRQDFLMADRLGSDTMETIAFPGR